LSALFLHSSFYPLILLFLFSSVLRVIIIDAFLFSSVLRESYDTQLCFNDPLPRFATTLTCRQRAPKTRTSLSLSSTSHTTPHPTSSCVLSPRKHLDHNDPIDLDLTRLSFLLSLLPCPSIESHCYTYPWLHECMCSFLVHFLSSPYVTLFLSSISSIALPCLARTDKVRWMEAIPLEKKEGIYAIWNCPKAEVNLSLLHLINS
jgi:hypothetical protein